MNQINRPQDWKTNQPITLQQTLIRGMFVFKGVYTVLQLLSLQQTLKSSIWAHLGFSNQDMIFRYTHTAENPDTLNFNLL